MRAAPTLLAAALMAALSAHADVIIDDANGYTLNAKNALVKFSSLGFDDKGRIVAVGSAAEVAARMPRAQHISVGGKTVLPGLIDAHGHVFGLGEMLSQLDLTSSTSLDGALKAIGDYARKEQGAWLRGRGWNQEIWKLGRFPTAQELDRVTGSRPAVLERVDGHAVWVNSAVLKLAGIDDKTPDPTGGKIVRDADGHATGILVDRAADLIEKVMPKTSEEQARAYLDAALGEMARQGLTSVHDAGVSASQDRLYRYYADHGKLSARIYGMIGGVGADFDSIVKGGGPLNSYGDDMYALRAVKLYSDGALGSRGAALLAPYSDEPKSKGLLFNSNAEMTRLIGKAMKAGYQVNVHAIGDAGNRQVIDIYGKLIKETRSVGQRHRIEHAQVVALADIPRFQAIGIIPSMQPTHATSDMNMAENRVGPERIKGAYAWRSYLHQGSRIACGSDFPVESPNPFYGLHAAVTRQDQNGGPAGGWYANQAMSLKEAFRCFTLDAAYAGHQEDKIGSLEPGKYADFIVIDRDLFTMPTYDIYQVKVLQTWVAGRQVFKR
ncbi:amidohydrolase [Massilia sp. TS11]|uniref:amidohydrolase n=1 Tax=Massilia sp. TS11 TaxID=2908003 RepID=UPI001EDC4425|nr:amidohydrolase [Massilia sp. TS11]MCG2586294.1 amidohydrolase [Massilia sp. TS11]